MNRKRFTTSLRKRFSLRLHMTLILMATSLAGVLASKGMLAIGLHNVALRYPITVLFAYLVFFAAIKIWIWLMTDAPVKSSNETGNNLLNSIDIPLPAGGRPEPAFTGGGGSFDGGGASSGFDDTLDKAGDVGEVVGDVVGGVADADDGLVVVVVLGLLAVLLFSVLSAGVFLVWQAPAILAEAAFNAVLAASLVRSTKRMNEPDWMGSVFKATWKPFGLVLALAIAAGWGMHHYLPKATRLLDVIHMVW